MGFTKRYLRQMARTEVMTNMAHPGEASANWITSLMGLAYCPPYGFLFSVAI
jgi:hypothetical protein